MIHAILLPALIVGLRAKRSFISIADCLDAIFRNSLPQKHALQRFRTVRSQRKVVLLRSPVVAMPFHRERKPLRSCDQSLKD